MTWFLGCMTQHPEVLTKVRAEVDALAASTPSFPNVDFTEFEKLEYLMRSVSETLRLNPPVFNTNFRVLMEPKTIGGYKIPEKVPKGDFIVFLFFSFFSLAF